MTTQPPPEHIAHLRKDEASGQWMFQSNDDHCKGVAEFCAAFAAPFGMSDYGHILGLLHDRGKQRVNFQNHIKRSSSFAPHLKVSGDKSHSFVGAKLLYDSNKLPAVIANIILGHHRGLYDCDELKRQLSKEIPPEVSTEMPEFKPKPVSVKGGIDGGDFSHLTRMLFSCLVDADYLDTERFMKPQQFEQRMSTAHFGQLNAMLECYLEKFAGTEATPLNTLRNKIQQQCKLMASMPPGFFDLTVPTGGGKTIASLIWAVNHAMIHGKKRIIIAIPFTIIIVQTAQILRSVFGENNVIEHHSVVRPDDFTETARLACENWDAPIIVTTNVQLFESMFSNRPTSCRKLHSLVNSVIILDEVQALPTKLLQPIVAAMKSYVKLFGASFLFCTASQPVLTGKRKGMGTTAFTGIDEHEICPIIPDDWHLHDKLRRVDIVMPRHNERTNLDDLANRLTQHNCVLCVVNTRSTAIELYNRISAIDRDNTFHLSRTMCADHIGSVIANIRQSLGCRTPQTVIRVVSTQLIEAGVDIDFPVVYRELTGLDSILQAAGRCNREGRAVDAKAFVFELEGINARRQGFIASATDAMRELRDLSPDADWLSPETMQLYYRKLYSKTPDFDYAGVVGLSSNPMNTAFETIAQKFKLIDDNYVPVIVNYGQASKLIDVLKVDGPSRSLLKNLGRYTVTVGLHHLHQLEQAGLVSHPFEGFNFIEFADQYDIKTGLRTDNSYVEQTFII